MGSALVYVILGFGMITNGCDFDLVSREDWNAKPAKMVERIDDPVPFVIIHHTFIPPACKTLETCMAAMREMQRMHQVDNGWNDIGYNFAAGGDGRIYEGRGWSCVGAHAPLYNAKSIGIAVIGDWRVDLPPEHQLKVVQQLIDFGVQKGYIAQDYTLHGHKQVRNGTDCPGEALLNEISKWNHFSDIVDVKFFPPM